MPPDTAAASPRGVRVWDAVVRILHWSLAALVVFCWVSDDGGPVHRNVGYVAAGLVVARLLWAATLAGEQGRLRALKPSVSDTLAYLRAGAPRRLGHDPLGLWMVWLLWAFVLLLALTGWISRFDMFWGDQRLHDIHAWLADGLLGAVVLHLLGVAAMSVNWKENLVRAMVDGRKRP